MTITENRRSRKSHRASMLSLLALGALGLVACLGGDNDEDRAAGASPRAEEKIERTGTEWAGARPVAREKIERTGNIFASHLAANLASPVRCGLMTQPACERITCETVSGPLPNCTPPSSKFRKSFEDATVREVAVNGELAVARFTNGDAVELRHLPGPDQKLPTRLSVWWISEVGGKAGEAAFITQVGNEWAPLFAKDVSTACRYMFGQPLCEEFFGDVGGPPEVRRPSGFQKSFANATVERVEIAGHKAVADFSNGELVEFIQETDAQQPLLGQLGDWFVDDVGGGAGRRFVE